MMDEKFSRFIKLSQQPVSIEFTRTEWLLVLGALNGFRVSGGVEQVFDSSQKTGDRFDRIVEKVAKSIHVDGFIEDGLHVAELTKGSGHDG